MRIALLTTYLAGYRTPLYERLAASHGLEVLCYGGGGRYVPPWIAQELDVQIAGAAFPARRLDGGPRAAFAVASDYDAVIAPYAGGAILPAAYAGARRASQAVRAVGFGLGAAALGHQPAGAAADAPHLPPRRRGRRLRRARPPVRRRYSRPRRRRFRRPAIGRARAVRRRRSPTPRSPPSASATRLTPSEPLVLYAGRLVPEKGVDVLLTAWRSVQADATLVVIGDGPLADAARETPGARLLGAMPRTALPVAYAACAFAVLASVPTPRFREPWGLVCNEAMHQAKPVLASTAVGAVAGGLVRDEITGIVVAPRDVSALATAIDRLLADEPLRARLGASGRAAVAAYNYDAMSAGFGRALAIAIRPSPTGP